MVETENKWRFFSPFSNTSLGPRADSGIALMDGGGEGGMGGGVCKTPAGSAKATCLGLATTGQGTNCGDVDMFRRGVRRNIALKRWGTATATGVRMRVMFWPACIAIGSMSQYTILCRTCR